MGGDGGQPDGWHPPGWNPEDPGGGGGGGGDAATIGDQPPGWQPDGWQPPGWNPDGEGGTAPPPPPAPSFTRIYILTRLRVHFLWSAAMQIIFLGRDNSFELALEADQTMRNASDFNRWVLYLNDRRGNTQITIDSATAGDGVFSAASSRYYNGRKVSTLRCKLGLGSFGLQAGTIYEAYVRAYSAEAPNGIVFPDQDDTFRLKVVQGP